jgi:hypothetical protein
MNKLNIEDYREFYNLYFKEFNRLAVGQYQQFSFGNDQPNDTCSSLESIIAYSNFILENSDKYFSILNAGAGASSWVFRKLFSQVLCSDPDKKYLDFIRHICIENKLDGYGFIHTLKGFNHADHVYYDYGMIERLPNLGQAIDIANVSVYVDDVDKRDCCYPYRQLTIDLCKSLGLKWFDCEESLDSYGRAGIIILK